MLSWRDSDRGVGVQLAALNSRMRKELCTICTTNGLSLEVLNKKSVQTSYGGIASHYIHNDEALPSFKYVKSIKNLLSPVM
jgi:hypothetical protein